MCMAIMMIMLMNVNLALNVQAESKEQNSASKFIIVDNKKMACCFLWCDR